MAEPHSTAALGALAGAGVSSMTIFLGAQVDALALGLAAAVFSSIWMTTIDNKTKAASAVLLSALLAGYGSPVAAQWVAANFTGIAGGDQLRLLLAVVIGLACPKLVPIVVAMGSKKVQGEQL
jgi:hypothetical protein